MIINSFEYNEDLLYPTNLYLNVTDDCNLQCKYCFVEQKPHYMSLDIAKQGIDWIYENYNKKEKITNDLKCTIYFFGGEPLLCYDSVIKPLVEYCNKIYPNIFSFEITTNGTLLTKEKLQFFKENNFSILLSIDGNQTTQNYNRPCKNNNHNSFELLENNISDILTFFPNITCRSTIYADTVDQLLDNYKYLEEKGFKSWAGVVDNLHLDLWTNEKKQILEEQINKLYYYRLEQLLNDQKPMKCSRIDSFITQNLSLIYKLADNLSNKETMSFCGLGHNSVTLGYNGNIYTCQEQVTKDNIKNIFQIGSIFNTPKIDKNKHQEILNKFFDDIKNTPINSEECKDCYLQKRCKYINLCSSHHYILYKNFIKMSDIECLVTKIKFKNSFTTLYFLLQNAEKNNAIKQYLTKLLS